VERCGPHVAISPAKLRSSNGGHNSDEESVATDLDISSVDTAGAGVGGGGAYGMLQEQQAHAVLGGSSGCSGGGGAAVPSSLPRALSASPPPPPAAPLNLNEHQHPSSVLAGLSPALAPPEHSAQPRSQKAREGRFEKERLRVQGLVEAASRGDYAGATRYSLCFLVVVVVVLLLLLLLVLLCTLGSYCCGASCC